MNPFKFEIIEYLRAGPCSELQILQHLEERFDCDALLDDLGLEHSSDSPDLRLFRLHFLIMNALYQLQAELVEDGWYVKISPLQCELLPVNAATSHALSGDHSSAALASYYLDWSELTGTDDIQVELLLKSFWQRYQNNDRLDDALTLLGLDRFPDNRAQLKRAYRLKAATTHPDKGGCAKQFAEIRSAYELLCSK